MTKRDLSKEILYKGVKQLVECSDSHIHLGQQKLYTLFSVAFQYFLFQSSKEPGHYIIRVEDSYLLDKLQKKAKDLSTRRFIQTLALPRRYKYGGSTFHLDFFNISTWSVTNDLPKEKVKGALVVKNATKKPMASFQDDEDEAMSAFLATLPDDYYYSSLREFVPKTICIAFEEEYEGCSSINFPFIVEEARNKVSKGVSIASDINLDDLEQ